MFAAEVDVRKYLPREKHPTIFRTFDDLNNGEAMQIINDHDPRPLQYQFMMERPNQFEWEFIEQGPEVWRVSIKKI
ncbi:DUF2249 domain-containing protein [Ammoniphilus resinae]|uniref:Uncharacterized protein (DUF2249 family) n=1 Tax=Ammoniphilus resinae TaxID=861532 RepID=A0ABS4GQZ4_9BACL|nr:DUF2249 domain-containing protein [Ammoniphilus resinae]MBP1932700.1 uncharacterized protein (DUF2249 family) [Ammoniphilus resinae]